MNRKKMAQEQKLKKSFDEFFENRIEQIAKYIVTWCWYQKRVPYGSWGQSRRMVPNWDSYWGNNRGM